MQGDIQLNYMTLGKNPLSSKTILVETLLTWDTCIINNRATIH